MRLVQVKGPSLQKILREVEKKNLDMVKDSLKESAIHVQKLAKERSPVVTGNFKKSIRRSVTGKRKTGEARSIVGVYKRSPAIKYAASVENKYKIFRILELREKKPVTNIFALSIRNYWKKQRIR